MIVWYKHDLIANTGWFWGEDFFLVVVGVCSKATLLYSHFCCDKCKLLRNLDWSKEQMVWPVKKSLLWSQCCRRQWRPKGWKQFQWTCEIIGDDDGDFGNQSDDDNFNDLKTAIFLPLWCWNEREKKAVVGVSDQPILTNPNNQL